MELMPYGSLEDLVKKASKAGAHFRNGDLWKVFQCRMLQLLSIYAVLASKTYTRFETVLKACVALAYPDSWGGGNIQDETVPQGDDGSSLPIQNAIIHFDISTDNSNQNPYR
jgi:hypothetical protein